jgi:hypothetical protein
VNACEVRETADWASYDVVTWTRRETVSLDNDPAYRPLIGKVLRTVQTLVVMKRGGRAVKVLDVPGTAWVPQLRNIPAKLPAYYYDGMICGVFPSGGTVRVAHIERAQGYGVESIGVYADVTSEGPFKGERVDIGALTEFHGPRPGFDDRCVEEEGLSWE